MLASCAQRLHVVGTNKKEYISGKQLREFRYPASWDNIYCCFFPASPPLPTHPLSWPALTTQMKNKTILITIYGYWVPLLCMVGKVNSQGFLMGTLIIWHLPVSLVYMHCLDIGICTLERQVYSLLPSNSAGEKLVIVFLLDPRYTTSLLVVRVWLWKCLAVFSCLPVCFCLLPCVTRVCECESCVWAARLNEQK